jgi:glycosyltransferase involved in cell wall biosynthesis
VEGIHEIIANGQSGYVVPQYDVAGLAEGIEELLNDPDKRWVFADKVFAHAMAKWDVSVMLNQLRAIYTRLAKQKLKLG